MLSLNSNPCCHIPFRSLSAATMSAETSYFPHFPSSTSNTTTTMSGAGQTTTPPTPPQEAPLSPPSRPATAARTGDYDDDEEEDLATPGSSCPLPAPTAATRSRPTPITTTTSTTTITISPPADYTNLDPNTVAEALEVARDSPDVAQDPVVSGILESALSQIWGRVMSSPESYVMTTGEFAVFNFYQQRFVGNKVAVAAIRRFWDKPQA